tara:strand:- start:523 stop:1089 length:567 start_codon:yes stop_codon:yes gene_type:complete
MMQTKYNNIRAQQRPEVFSVFDEFFKENDDIDQIVELGTSSGGLSEYLYEKSIELNSSFVTYDINPRRRSPQLNRKILCRIIDTFSPQGQKEINSLLKSPKKTLLLCDGGDKSREVNLFSKSLKSGDIIMAHDYSPTKEYFEEHMRNKIWNWHEIEDDHIKQSIEENNLGNYDYYNFLGVAWMCRIKK